MPTTDSSPTPASPGPAVGGTIAGGAPGPGAGAATVSPAGKVVESLLKHQRDFFDYGSDRLRPLVLQDVADDVGVHMSTVSRATTNKYLDTPHGIFELKFFFSAAVPQQSGGDMAAEAIKSKIRTMIAAEDHKKPLSDQQIADTLSRKDGIAVARRTVAKYREALGILPSSHRKQMF